MRKIAIIWFVTIFWGGFTVSLTAQEVISTVDFFALATPSAVVNNSRPLLTMPWVEKYEFRTETRDFDPDEQEYTLRLSPSTGRKRRAQTALYQHQENRPDFDLAERNCEQLADRYADWAGLYFLDRENTLLAALETVLKDRKTVLNRLAGSLDFAWDALIKLREEETELSLRRSARQTQFDQLLVVYGLQRRELTFKDMVKLEELPGRLSEAATTGTDPKIIYELEQVTRELELEKAEQKQYIDFAQLRYQGPHTDLPRERLSVGIGFQLPNSGNQRLKVRELELEREALGREAEQEKLDRRLAYEQKVRAWILDYQYYGKVSQTFSEEEQELSRIGDQLRRKDGFNPIPLLSIKERSLRNELQQLRIAAQLYEDYLDVRELMGDLCPATGGELLR